MSDLLYYLLFAVSSLVVIELISITVVKIVNKKFQWLIIDKDKTPKLSDSGLKKFFFHGYDPVLGWIRKQNTSHSEQSGNKITNWNINLEGYRANPKHESLSNKISCYGDSFTFARQVNDNETWEYYLSKLTNTNVKNFGVGNYGLDQSLLRLKREFLKNKTELVILGVVPDTISRIVSVWKHYYEYGNTFGFKPRFYLKNNKLCLLENIINSESKFFNYNLYLSEIQNFDFFYSKKFKKELLSFPYFISILKNPKRNISIIFWIFLSIFFKFFRKNSSDIEFKAKEIIMNINLKWRLFLFNDDDTLILFKKILEDYVKFSKQNNFKAIFIFFPQKDDVLFIKSKYHFYENLLHQISSIDGLYFIDILQPLLKEENIDSLYSDNNSYGGHYSAKGNKKISDIIYSEITKLNL
jgi:hypothetical protein